MLDETWAYKTHDLTYKGGEVDPAYEHHVRLLSDALRVLDDQSQLLDRQIRETKQLRDAFLFACVQESARAAAIVMPEMARTTVESV
jgi:ppGpp synthetase/RelA/SpoT-type nucleotidyltranferase